MIFMITSILYNTTWTLLFTFNVAYSRFKTFKILSYQTSDINFFLTQGRDVHPLLRLRHCYPTLPNYCFMSTTTTTTTTTTTAQLNNLPLTAIIFIIKDGTIRSNNHKKTSTRNWCNMCPSRRHLMKHWRSTFVLKCITYYF